MIPIEHKDEVVQTGISFMRAITDAFGADEGMRLWDTIATTLDPDVKGAIFFTLLTGESSNRITVRGVSGNPGLPDKVQLIKSIRVVTGLGLKEAKDHADVLMGGGYWDRVTGQWESLRSTGGVPTTIVIKIQPGKSRHECVTELRNAGCII